MEQNYTQQELLEHIRQLTNAQNELVREMNSLKARSSESIINFRTPDSIRYLPTYEGKKTRNPRVESALQLFDEYKNSAIYDQIVRAVKNKITGEAREAIIAAGNVSTWPEIKGVLQNIFDDKRDLAFHLQTLFYEKQGNKTLLEYYNNLKSVSSKVRAITAVTEEYKNSIEGVHHLIGVITLTRFIDGLEGSLSSYVRCSKPKNIDEAYSISAEYTNAAYRKKLERIPIQDRKQKPDTYELPSTSYESRSTPRVAGPMENTQEAHSDTGSDGSASAASPSRAKPSIVDRELELARKRFALERRAFEIDISKRVLGLEELAIGIERGSIQGVPAKFTAPIDQQPEYAMAYSSSLYTAPSARPAGTAVPQDHS
ncbi:uncharacterized protein LOC131293857 [Anopheles ziemanni]|uniref:uncharacterized protein LOC131264624 n=1 Tax=Anopheles coustani TaxID=139045 RepID=UPI0026588153|nr:uncharacterized protein LOC131264624 [Anopheles coustani]XP_058177891.1 uncharacterized protein LOC131293857 [Anopheles ziemanni]